MQSDAKQRSRYRNMVLWRIFAEILQGTKTSWQLLDFIEDNQGFPCYDRDLRNGFNRTNDALNIVVNEKRFG